MNNKKTTLIMLIILSILLTGCSDEPMLNGKKGLTEEVLNERIDIAMQTPFSGDINDLDFCVGSVVNEKGRDIHFSFLNRKSCRFVKQECEENKDVCKWDVRTVVNCWKGECEPQYQGHCTCRFDKELINNTYWREINE